MKDKYRILCDTEPTIPLFSQAWWLDAVAEESWDVAVVENAGKVIASMPYTLRKRYGLTLITQPKLTQTLGPWIQPSDAKYAKRLSQEKDLMSALIKKLPHYHHFRQNWHHKQTNWLPFYWAGFKQTTRYTYRIDELNCIEKLWKNMQGNIRTDIKKASNREQLRIRDDLSIDDFIKLNSLVFKRQGLQVPYSKEFVKNLDNAANSRNCRKIFIAEDNKGKRHAGVYIVWDKYAAYYLMGGGDPELRNSGATSLCIWEAIKFASSVTETFDFEGTMIEPVERFFRAFGAKQTAYHYISHTPSRILRGSKAIREFIK